MPPAAGRAESNFGRTIARVFSVALAAAVTVVTVVATEARAQVFSPGALSQAHEALDGIAACTKCHVEGGRHDRTKCLECHKEIGTRVDAGTGYHASAALKARECAECHREHRGAKAKLIEWTPSRDNFNHSLTGWPLSGGHKKPKCQDCHELRRIEDNVVKNLITKKGRDSYLGLSTRCADCHFDEHRGQEGSDCIRCHDTDNFKKAPLFNHNDKKDARFGLVGKHKTVTCRACHEPLTDTKTQPGAFPAPKDMSYLQLKDIPFAQCTACHDDPHRGTYGKSCSRCHTPAGWRTIKEDAQDTGFHDKHAFKLRGEHQSVACKLCHGPFGTQPAKFKGIKFQRCADCHADAHVGQLAGKNVQCENCHTVNGFTPVLFDVVAHDKTRFPLELAHRAVACTNCHKEDARLKDRVPASVRAELERKGRRVLVSSTRLAMPDVVADSLVDVDPNAPEVAKGVKKEPSDCAGCHEDVHDGQFSKPLGEGDKQVPKKACSRCHDQTSFADLNPFNHDDTRFRLTGKHQKTECGSCHVKSTKRSRTSDAVVYRGMGTECADCHADEHVGQLAAKDGHTDCGACHATSGFKTDKFDHTKQSTFPLEGKHRETKCAECHVLVPVGEKKIARYKPLPSECAACHEDEHKGSFDSFNPRVAADATPETKKQESRCDACHVAAGWLASGTRFAHERTGFALTGRHASTRCASCHGSNVKRPLPPTCVGCHRDPHAQEFGLMCSSCHSTDAFIGPAFPVDAHRRNNFPLNGRHAALPCDSCHVEKRDRTFARAPIDCLACHVVDSIRASQVSVDHRFAPFVGVSCIACHVPTTFAPAQFPQHDACFPISRGVHAPIRCAECHAASALVGARAQGACRDVAVLCAQCHTHAAEVEDPRHADVPGYAHNSERCAGCHRTP